MTRPIQFAIRCVLIVSMFLSTSSFRRYLPTSCISLRRFCSSTFIDKELLEQICASSFVDEESLEQNPPQKHAWNDFRKTCTINFGYGSLYYQLKHPDPIGDGIAGTCKLCGTQANVLLRRIEHPSIIYLPSEWIRSTSCPPSISDLPKGREYEKDDGDYVTKSDDSGDWYSLREKLFLNESYFEGYQSNDSTAFLNRIMEDDAYGIRSAWESRFGTDENGIVIDMKNSVCRGQTDRIL